MQRQRLNDFMQHLDFRQRMAKAVCKVLFVFFVVCCVLAFWASLVSCSFVRPFMQPIRHLDDLGDTSGDPVWPAQGCGIPKLTEPVPFDPSRTITGADYPETYDPSSYTGTINIESL